jgi:hypothetical protein
MIYSRTFHIILELPTEISYAGTSQSIFQCWNCPQQIPLLGLITAISYIKKHVKQLRTNRQTEYSPASLGDWLRKQVVGQLSCGGPLGLVEKATNLHNLLAPNDSLILPPISTCHFGHLTTQSCYLFPIFSFLAIFSLSSLSSNLFLSPNYLPSDLQCSSHPYLSFDAPLRPSSRPISPFKHLSRHLTSCI